MLRYIEYHARQSNIVTPFSKNLSADVENQGSSTDGSTRSDDSANRGKKKKLIVGIAVVLVVAIGGAVGAMMATKKPKTASKKSSAKAPTNSTLAPSDLNMTYTLEATVLSRGVKFNKTSSKDSRNVALDWLLKKDKMSKKATDFNLKQRYILALLAFEFGTVFRTYSKWPSDKNECTWVGVTCNKKLEVIKLELGKFHPCPYYTKYHSFSLTKEIVECLCQHAL
jgi:hypothetical protein